MTYFVWPYCIRNVIIMFLTLNWDSSFSDTSNFNVFMQLDGRFTQKLFKGVTIDLVLIA